MSDAGRAPLHPRKQPVQARSEASVRAILEATVQVLLKEGRPRLTTTRVAERAGVSVGTLYQYFPNKSALLQALLREHLDGVAAAMEAACRESWGAPLAGMAESIVSAFVAAKFRNIDASVTLYAVSDDVEGRRIAQEMHRRSTQAMAAMLATAPEGMRDPQVTAETLLSAMAGVSRAMLERGVTHRTMAAMKQELRVLVRAYLRASADGAG